jgi:hypothetical protein
VLYGNHLTFGAVGQALGGPWRHHLPLLQHQHPAHRPTPLPLYRHHLGQLALSFRYWAGKTTPPRPLSWQTAPCPALRQLLHCQMQRSAALRHAPAPLGEPWTRHLATRAGPLHSVWLTRAQVHRTARPHHARCIDLRKGPAGRAGQCINIETKWWKPISRLAYSRVQGQEEQTLLCLVASQQFNYVTCKTALNPS